MQNKTASIIKGLLPPLDEAQNLYEKYYKNCGCNKEHSGFKVDNPIRLEHYLASRQHRNAQVRKYMNEFFLTIQEGVTSLEKELLYILNLPDIETTRNFVLGAAEKPNLRKKFEINKNQINAIKEEIKETQNYFIGNKNIKQTDIEEEENPVYQFYMLLFFGIWTRKQVMEFIRLGNSGLSEEQLRNTIVSPNLKNKFISAVINRGIKSITNMIGNPKYEFIINGLKRHAKAGSHPFDVAKWIHQYIGEGELWRWNRIVRSESTLALEAAYDAQSNASGIQYDEWSAGSGACPICSSLDGLVWKRGEGAIPVSDTHPHCLCRRVGYYSTNKIIQSRWEEPSPYKN